MRIIAAVVLVLSSAVAVAQSSGLRVESKLFYFQGGQTHGVDLNWTDATTGGQVTGHNIYRATTAGVCKWSTGSASGQTIPAGCTKVGSTAALTFSDTSAPLQVEGAKFFYVETATGPGGESPSSNEVSATIPFSIPGAPTQGSPVPH